MKYLDIKNKILDFIEQNNISEAKNTLKQAKYKYPYNIDIKHIEAYICYINKDFKKSEYICNNILKICPLHLPTNKLLVNIYIETKNFHSLKNSYMFFLNLCLLDDFRHESIKICEYIDIIFNENNILYIDIDKFFIYKDFGFPIENYLYKKINSYYFSRALIKEIDFFNKYYKNIRLEAFKEYDNSLLLANKNYILPIHSLVDENILSLPYNNQIYEFLLNNVNYNLFKFKYPENTHLGIIQNSNLFLGKPIPKFKFENNKDLILTLFIDGLSQKVIEENGGLEKLMPHTYNFFKGYMYCNNCYVSGEWTYVSIASYFTGQYTTNHKLFHPNINASLNENNKILSEYINNKNYFTSKIDGEWRSNFPMGYYRGFDYILYELSLNDNLCAKEIPSLLIDHIEAFKDTNMYIYTCIPDLHDIADGYIKSYPIQVQENYDEKPNYKNFQKSETSVRTNYSESKIKSYIRTMKYIDTHLRTLYCYLEDNFNLDNITVSLISDHGQGYIIKPDEEFLSDGRLKVPLLIRSKEAKNVQCNEFVQNIDYIAIMDKILNLNVNYRNIDANLPSCLGGNKREYTYSESIFPDAPYRALINIDTYEFFFETIEKVGHDGRVILDDYRTHLKDKVTREDIDNKELLEKCISIVFEHMKYNRIYI